MNNDVQTFWVPASLPTIHPAFSILTTEKHLPAPPPPYSKSSPRTPNLPPSNDAPKMSSKPRLATLLLTISSHCTRPLSVLTHLRHFHSSPATLDDGRSPKAKNAEWARRHRPAGQQQRATPQRAWPTGLLYAVHRAGGLPIHPAFAVAFLDAFERLTRYKRPEKSTVVRLCAGEYSEGEVISTGRKKE